MILLRQCRLDVCRYDSEARLGMVGSRPGDDRFVALVERARRMMDEETV